jgi:hypothetical protein
MVNWSYPDFWFGLIQMIFNALISVYLWINRRYQATNKAFSACRNEMTGRIEKSETSLVRIETDLTHMPGQKQFDALGKDIRSLTRELGELKGRLEGINRVADLMNEYLINRDG